MGSGSTVTGAHQGESGTREEQMGTVRIDHGSERITLNGACAGVTLIPVKGHPDCYNVVLRTFVAPPLDAGSEKGEPVAWLTTWPGGDRTYWPMQPTPEELTQYPNTVPLYASPVVPEPVAPMGWQPIETAPKDGTEIIVWPYWAGGKATAVRWRCGRTARTQRWESVGGLHCPTEPTHWMPLPAPPGAAAEGGSV